MAELFKCYHDLIFPLCLVLCRKAKGVQVVIDMFPQAISRICLGIKDSEGFKIKSNSGDAYLFLKDNNPKATKVYNIK